MIINFKLFEENYNIKTHEHLESKNNNFKKIPKSEANCYYIIHMEKSIEKFNIALDKLKFKNEFYKYFDETNIPISDKLYLIFEDTTFYINDNLSSNELLYSKYYGQIYVSDLEVYTQKYNL